MGLGRLHSVIIERDGLNCHLCGLPCKGTGFRRPTIDHVIPRSKGGTNHYDNLKIAHEVCNHLRNDQDITDEVIRQCRKEILRRIYGGLIAAWAE